MALTLTPSSFVLTANSAQADVGMTINSSQSTTPGVYNFTVVAKYGTSSNTYGFTVDLVKYLITAYGQSFSPNNLTVKEGSTVYWFNLYINDDFPEPNVMFTSGTSAQSPFMGPYGSYSYTFTTPGAYTYVSTPIQGMNGTIIVTA